MSLPSGLRLDIEDRPADADVEVLPNALEAFNESRWPGHQKWRPLAVFARERETIVAGLERRREDPQSRERRDVADRGDL